MLKEFWSVLKSGTDIRGVAVAGAGFDVNLTDDTVNSIVNGFMMWLSDKTGKPADEMTISVGRDSRISGPQIAKVTKQTLLNAGVCVIDCGMCTTPAMFMTTVELGCDAAVEITASHHPYYRNGLKFFTREGGLEGSDINAILEYAQNGDKPGYSSGGELIENEYMRYYAGNLREFIKAQVNDKGDYEHPLKGFKFVVDAGNGVGGFYAADVLEALGADVRGSQFLEPDGTFPNHIPNPEDPAAMAAVCEAVKAFGADFGIIFDTDVDRCGAVDSQGKEINRNRLVALAAAIVLENCPGELVVTDSITSSGLKEFIEKNLKGKHLRFKRGYKNVIDEAIRQNKNKVPCSLAIETSGHAAMKENYFLDDGAYLITKIIIKIAQLRMEGKKLESLIADLKEPVETKEIRIKITDKDFRACGEKVIKKLTAYAEKQKDFKVADDNYEGIRVSFDKNNGDGWFLLRLSVHDPIMPLNIESDSAGGVDKIYSKLKTFLEDCEGLETYVKKAAPKAAAKSDAKALAKAAPKTLAAAEAPKAAKADAKTVTAVKAVAPNAEIKVAPAAKAEVKKEAPKAEVKAEAPKAEVKAEAPKAEVKAEAPKAEVKAEAPKAEVKAEAPKAEVKAEAPKAEVKAEAPKAEVKAEAPKAEVKAEAPKAEVKAEVKKEAPKTEVKKEAPKAEVKKEAPKAEVKAAPAKGKKSGKKKKK